MLIVIGGHDPFLRKWMKDSIAVTLAAVGRFDDTVYLDIFIDGQWGWSSMSRLFQVLMITLASPFSGRGYVVAIALMDGKREEDYRSALKPFCKQLKTLMLEFGLVVADSVRLHCDEETAMINAFIGLMGVDELQVIGCRFHKLQNLVGQLKSAFPAR